MSRDITIKIRIKTKTKEEFQAHAENRGITMSGLGAYIIGEWVINQKEKHAQIPQIEQRA